MALPIERGDLGGAGQSPINKSSLVLLVRDAKNVCFFLFNPFFSLILDRSANLFPRLLPPS
jgi:hypothetical protein